MSVDHSEIQRMEPAELSELADPSDSNVFARLLERVSALEMQVNALEDEVDQRPTRQEFNGLRDAVRAMGIAGLSVDELTTLD